MTWAVISEKQIHGNDKSKEYVYFTDFETMDSSIRVEVALLLGLENSGCQLHNDLRNVVSDSQRVERSNTASVAALERSNTASVESVTASRMYSPHALKRVYAPRTIPLNTATKMFSNEGASGTSQASQHTVLLRGLRCLRMVIGPLLCTS